jgi:hypothetical protein
LIDSHLRWGTDVIMVGSPLAGRDRPEWVVAINRNAWSQTIE